MNDSNRLASDLFLNPERAERELQAVERAIAEAEERLRRLEARHSNFLAVVYSSFTDITGMPSLFGVSRSQWAHEALNSALNPYWFPSPLSWWNERWREDWWHRQRRFDPERPPDQWHGSLVVQSVEYVTCQREAVFFMYVPDRWIDFHVPFSFEGRVERYIPTGEVGMSRLEMELRAASDRARRQLDQRCAGYLDELIQAVLTLILPLRHQVVLTFHPDLGPAEGEEQLRIHGCDYRNRRWHEKNVKSDLKWPPLAKFEAPKVGERYGLASYRGICWVCQGHWELHRYPAETLTRILAGIERIARPLLEQIASSVHEIAMCRQAIVLLRRRKEKLIILYLQTPLIASAEQTGIFAPARAGIRQIPQTAQNLMDGETKGG